MTYFIISFRKIKQAPVNYLLGFLLQTVGFVCLFNSFFLYRLYDYMPWIMVSSAAIIFLISQLMVHNTRTSGRDFGVRKVFGAEIDDVYKVLITDSFLITITSGLASLIFLEMSVREHLSLYLRHLHFPDLITSSFLFGSIVVVTLFTTLIPAIRLSMVDITKLYVRN